MWPRQAGCGKSRDRCEWHEEACQFLLGWKGCHAANITCKIHAFSPALPVMIVCGDTSKIGSPNCGAMCSVSPPKTGARHSSRSDRSITALCRAPVSLNRPLANSGTTRVFAPSGIAWPGLWRADSSVFILLPARLHGWRRSSLLREVGRMELVETEYNDDVHGSNVQGMLTQGYIPLIMPQYVAKSAICARVRHAPCVDSLLLSSRYRSPQFA